MRVLHLPINISSQMNVTVRALRDLGINAHGVTLSSPYDSQNDGLRNLHRFPSSRPLSWLNALYSWLVVSPEIARSDIIHWHFGTTLKGDLDLKLAQLLRKPGVVEFWGSDVRVPEEEIRLNPYYHLLGNGHEKTRLESRERSNARQDKFVAHGVTSCFIGDTCTHYLKPNVWRRVYYNRGRVFVSEFSPAYPSPDNRKPIIAHSPTAKIWKGTQFVERALEKLKDRYDFEYKLVYKMPYKEAQQVKQTCDIFIDQLLGGIYGLSAIEAMAMGKPVVCYIRPTAQPFMPADLPIINANPDNLADVLEPLMKNAKLRHDIGMQSRCFAERYHDAHEYARWLISVYEELLTTSRKAIDHDGDTP